MPADTQFISFVSNPSSLLLFIMLTALLTEDEYASLKIRLNFLHIKKKTQTSSYWQTASTSSHFSVT